jgi:hypothetical protein
MSRVARSLADEYTRKWSFCIVIQVGWPALATVVNTKASTTVKAELTWVAQVTD